MPVCDAFNSPAERIDRGHEEKSRIDTTERSSEVAECEVV